MLGGKTDWLKVQIEVICVLSVQINNDSSRCHCWIRKPLLFIFTTSEVILELIMTVVYLSPK